MTLNEMKQLLVAEDLRLTKSLGQNFLHDGNQLKRIVAAAELAPADKVLEIGPGLGPLTERLLEQAGEVFAIEKDARLVKILQRRFATETEKNTGETPVLRLLHADALEYLQRETRDWSEWKLVSNLPYSVASPILVELAAAGRGPRRMVATLQIEVAKRLCAQAGSPDYGLLTLLVQLHYESRGWFKIPAGCFFPAPEVDSACVCLVRREQPLLPPEPSTAQPALGAPPVAHAARGSRHAPGRVRAGARLSSDVWPYTTVRTHAHRGWPVLSSSPSQRLAHKAKVLQEAQHHGPLSHTAQAAPPYPVPCARHP